MTTTLKEKLIEEANKDATLDPKRVSVLYGDYGSWKTSISCSMANERGLLLSSDESWKVLLNNRHREVYAKFQPPYGKIVPLEGLSQLAYVDMNDYDTIIWDTLSQSVDVYLDLLYDEANWGGKYRDKIVSKHPDLRNLETLAPVDYRVTRDSIRPILNRLFRETSAHIIFTSQVTEPITGLSANPQKRPSIPQATFKIVGTRADIIGNTRVTNNKGTVDVTQSLTQLGKSRIEGIQGAMNPDQFVAKYKEIVFK